MFKNNDKKYIKKEKNNKLLSDLLTVNYIKAKYSDLIIYNDVNNNVLIELNKMLIEIGKDYKIHYLENNVNDMNKIINENLVLIGSYLRKKVFEKMND